MSGMPNWTHDIGGFALEDRYTNQEPAHVAEWRELNLRWFQFGAFSPLFRSHGETPKREIFEIAADDQAMYDAMVWYDQLRYRLMPYIYTIAADTWHKDGTMMRGLVMDFPARSQDVEHRRRIYVRPGVPRRAGDRIQGARAARSICPPGPAGTTSRPARS